MTSLRRRLQKLELRSLAYGLAAQPDGEAKRFVIARIQAIRERLQAARDRGEYVPTVDVGEVKARLRAVLEDMRRRGHDRSQPSSTSDGAVVRTIARRLQKLEEGFGPTEQLLVVVTAADRGLALDQDRCIQILRECGSLPTGPVGVVNLGDIPEGLNANELERFLRKNGAETRGLRSAQNH